MFFNGSIVDHILGNWPSVFVWPESDLADITIELLKISFIYNLIDILCDVLGELMDIESIALSFG